MPDVITPSEGTAPVSRTACPMCGGLETRRHSQEEAVVNLRCGVCEQIWQIADRRATRRFPTAASFDVSS